ncbi:MAG: DinB family protein [Chloroflexi bacterium]|nr:DinB family protein [Chloroflexota bacterium]MDA1239373.1 DinB family protein [Chloroflexota bacterium]
MDTTYLQENDASRAELTALIACLSEADLRRETHSGWTVAATLAHLAYWDRRYGLVLKRYDAGDWDSADVPHWVTDVENDAALPEWRALPPAEAVRLALEAAVEVDAIVAAVSPATVQTVLDRRQRWVVYRYSHRREHFAEIEAALSREG